MLRNKTSQESKVISSSAASHQLLRPGTASQPHSAPGTRWLMCSTSCSCQSRSIICSSGPPFPFLFLGSCLHPQGGEKASSCRGQAPPSHGSRSPLLTPRRLPRVSHRSHTHSGLIPYLWFPHDPLCWSLRLETAQSSSLSLHLQCRVCHSSLGLVPQMKTWALG